MELADTADRFDLPPDRRPAMPEPPPVRLISVDDVVLLAPPGVEPLLDAFYVGLLQFERADHDLQERVQTEPILGRAVPHGPPQRVDRPLPPLPASAIQGPVYRAENH